MQHGSVIQTSRREGPNVWQFRWSEKDLNGHRVYRKRVIGTVEQYADAAAVCHAALALLPDVYLRSRQDQIGSITIDQLCEHFEQSEMRSGANLWSIATQRTYRGYIRRWIRPRWALALWTRLRQWKWKLGCMGSILPAPQEPRFETSFVSSSIMLVGMSCLIATQYALFAKVPSADGLRKC